MLHKLYKYIT